MLLSKPQSADIRFQQLFCVQVMKMLMPLLTPAAGVVHMELPEGSVLLPGQLIGRLDLDDPSAVLRAVPFSGNFPPFGPPLVHSGKVDDIFGVALADAKAIMSGEGIRTRQNF